MMAQKKRATVPPPSTSSSSASSSSSSGDEESDREHLDLSQSSRKPPSAPVEESAEEEEEEEDDEEEEEEEEVESEESNDSRSQPQIPSKPLPKASPVADAAASESGSESESGGDSDPVPAPVSTPPPKSSTSSGKKRASSRSPPPKVAVSSSTLSKKIIERIWTDNDELVLLKALANYVKQHGSRPSSQVEHDEFSKLVSNSFHKEFNRGQLNSKITRMKKRFLSNMARLKEGSKREPVGGQVSFELSKKIWGSDEKDAMVAPTKESAEDMKGSAKDKGKKMVKNDDADAEQGVDWKGKKRVNNGDAGEEGLDKKGKRKKGNYTSIADEEVKEKLQNGENEAPNGIPVIAPVLVKSCDVMYPIMSQMLDDLDDSRLNTALHGILKRGLKNSNHEKMMALEFKLESHMKEQLRLSMMRRELLNEAIKTILEEL